MIRFIGDVHGKFNSYKKIIADTPVSIQLGDMGVGFKKFRADRELVWDTNPPFDAMSQGNHRFIRGNHDNPEVCKNHKYWIPDGHVENNIMFIGGAVSIDRAWRTEGIDYWPDEELSYSELEKLIAQYEQVKPEIMVTHECPESIAEQILQAFNRTKFNDNSRTRQAFEQMLYIHQPKYWLFGHWHMSLQFKSGETQFILLNELESIDLEV